MPDAVRCYEAGLSELKDHSCPSIEWKIMSALSAADARLNRHEEAHQWRAGAREVIERLTDSIREDGLRSRFKNARPVRESLQH